MLHEGWKHYVRVFSAVAPGVGLAMNSLADRIRSRATSDFGSSSTTLFYAHFAKDLIATSEVVVDPSRRNPLGMLGAQDEITEEDTVREQIDSGYQQKTYTSDIAGGTFDRRFLPSVVPTLDLRCVNNNSKVHSWIKPTNNDNSKQN